jgi:hypothetical protein
VSCLKGFAQIAKRQVRVPELVEHHQTASLKPRIVGCRGCKLIKCRRRGLKDFPHCLRAHPLHVTETSCDVDHKTVCCLLRQLKVTRRSVPLFFGLLFIQLRDGALLDSNATLRVRETSEARANTRPAARLPVRTLRRLVAPWCQALVGRAALVHYMAGAF